MLVCHCKVVYDRDIRAAIAAGARDEFDVAEACGAGASCGGCLPAVSALLAEAYCAPGCPVTHALRPPEPSSERDRPSAPVRSTLA